MKKVKVLEVIGSMNMGGAETLLMNIFKNIDRKKFEMIFLCYGNQKFDYEDELTNLGEKIIRISKPTSNIFKNVKQIKKVIKDNSIDVVHCHTYFNSMYALIAAKQCKIKKRITHSHNTISEKNPSILKKIYFFVSKLVINLYSTDFLACGKEAGEALFFRNQNFKIIDNGIILDRFYYDSEIREKKRKELKLPDGYQVIGHVGRFEEAKNHEFLVDLFDEYHKKHKKSILLLIGDGSLRTSIEKKIREKHLQNKIFLLLKRSDVNEIYNAMDLFLFPSLYEGLPVVLIEAQTNGLPIVASDTIDKDSDYTKTISFLSLNEDKNVWINEIEDRIGKRVDNKKIMENSKYNIKNTVSQIEEIYSNF